MDRPSAKVRGASCRLYSQIITCASYPDHRHPTPYSYPRPRFLTGYSLTGYSLGRFSRVTDYSTDVSSHFRVVSAYSIVFRISRRCQIRSHYREGGDRKSPVSESPGQLALQGAPQVLRVCEMSARQAQQLPAIIPLADMRPSMGTLDQVPAGPVGGQGSMMFQIRQHRHNIRVYLRGREGDLRVRWALVESEARRSGIERYLSD